MSLTITIPGAVSTTTGSTAPAVLTVGVGAPGQGVPSGGTSGQVLQKLSGVSYDTGWLTLPADFITSVTAPLAVGSGVLSVDLSAYSTTAQAAALYYPLSGNPAGYVTSATAPVTSVAGKVGAVTLDNTDISGLGTMSTATAADYSTTTVANGLYYPLSGNPSSFLVAANITGKADLASPALTGNITITTNSTGPALFIEQTGTGNILTLHDQASDTTFVAIDQSGKVLTIPSTTATAGLNVPHGAAPTTPVNGDIFSTTGGLFARINGATQQYPAVASTNTFTGINTFTNASVSVGTSTAASTINVGTGATLTATTKAVNIGTAGVAGSTTNIAIGSATGTSTTTLQGATNGITASVDTNTTALATTAYVVGNGYAKLASPTFTGTPTLPTGSIGVTQSPGNNTTALATTAYVTAAVPAFATFAQSQQGDSTTTAMSPFDTITAMMAEGYRPALALSGGTSGTGASNNIVSLALTQVVGPNVLTAGYAYVATNSAGAYSTASTSTNTIKFNKPIWISGVYDTSNATFQGDANTEAKAYIGFTMLNGDDPTGAAIGWWKLGGASTPFNLMVHNGTTLTKVASATSTVNSGTPFRWMVYSDGAGNVTLYINGVSVATTALGPTGTTQANTGQFTAAVKASVTATTRMLQNLTYPKIYVAPQ